MITLLHCSQKTTIPFKAFRFFFASDMSIFDIPQHFEHGPLRILNTEFRQSVTTRVPRSRPLSHRRLSMSRPSTDTPIYPHLGWDRPRSVTHTALVPPGKRSVSARSDKAHTQPELKQEPTQEPVENRNRSLRQERLSSRPCAAFQTTVFGPQSDISNLVPALTPRPASTSSSRSTDRARAQQRAGWCHLPGRYLLEEQRVMALNRQIGCPLHTHRRSPLLRQTGQGGELQTLCGLFLWEALERRDRPRLRCQGDGSVRV